MANLAGHVQEVNICSVLVLQVVVDLPPFNLSKYFFSFLNFNPHVMITKTMTCHKWRQCEEEFVQHEILSWGSPCTRSTGWGQHYGHNCNFWDITKSPKTRPL